MSDDLDRVIDKVRSWDGIRVEPHRFGGQEFRLDRVEIGHVHRGGLVDIPFTRAVRDYLVAENLAQPHHILPDTGWISFRMRDAADVERALWLLRLSYLQKRLRRTRRDAAQQALLIADLDSLKPDAALRDLIAQRAMDRLRGSFHPDRPE
jgi:Luciferase